MFKKLAWLGILLTLLIGAARPWAAEEPESLLDDDDRLIESAGLPSEGPSLLEFFRTRSRIAAEPGKIDELLRRFAGAAFQDRIQAEVELVAEGPVAVAGLRRVANDLDDVEARERARRCLAWVEGPRSAALTMAAARVVARRKPAGSAEALLAYLPYADNDDVVREVGAALQAVGGANGKADPALVRALSDSMPLRRALAAMVLSQVAPVEQKQNLEKLLQDPVGEVRMKAALALAKANNAAAIPVLIDLLAVLPVAQRDQVEETLNDIAGEWAPAGGPTAEDEIARRIRRDAWAAWWANTDSPALLAMFKKRTLTTSEHEKVKDAMKRLGDASFAVREKAVVELIARGRMVLPMLRDLLKEGNLEVVRRAQRCIERIENEPANRLPAAALRLLALRKPPTGVETLLAYLPFAEEETLADVEVALGVLAQTPGKPHPGLLAALEDSSPTLRATAAEALAHGSPEARAAVRKLLKDDNLTVRRRAAQALAPRDAAAIPTLIDLLAQLDNDQAAALHDFLVPLAGDQAPAAPEDNAESRKKTSAVWADWWKAHAAKADLTKLIEPQHQRLGYTVVCEHNTGRIYEMGRDRKVRWSFNGTRNPVDVLVLPNNRVVVAEYTANMVTERDFKGQVRWQKQLNGNPHNIQRLPNGHIFIATNQQLVEVDRNGKDVFTLNNPQQIINRFGQFSGAGKSRKGHLVCMSQNGTCSILDKTGKQLKTFNTQVGNAWMDLLPNGRILMAQNGGNQIREYDEDGKLHLDINYNQVTGVTGLPNGNILVASNSTGRVAELDRKGKVLWEHQAQGPFRARGR